MLDIKYIRENKEIVQKACKDKCIDLNVDTLLDLDKVIRETMLKLDTLRSERNKLSETVPSLSGDEKLSVIHKVKEIKESLTPLEAKVASVQEQLKELLLLAPTIPGKFTPVGTSEKDNVEVSRFGEIPVFNFETKDHVTLAENLDLIDTARATKFAGSRTYFLKNDAMLLEMAICKYVMDKLVSKGFTPMRVPTLVKENAMEGTGFFPGAKESVYTLEKDELYLVGTAEVSLVSYHMDEILDYKELPKLYAGLSQAYRREAGTYGKDTRGLYRVHEFTKVEQVVICEADDETGSKMYDFILSNAKEILEDLKLPYRIIETCTADMGQGKARMQDIETWMPSRNGYGETHSCSILNDFQARRSNIKYRDAEGNIKFVYTLNNTAIASPRILIPILEIYQNEDGSINIPEVLIPYMNGKTKIEKK